MQEPPKETRDAFGFQLDANRLIAGARIGRGPSYLRPLVFLVVLQFLVLAISLGIGIVISFYWIGSRASQGLEIDTATITAEIMELISSGPVMLIISLPQFILMIVLTLAWIKWIEKRPLVSIGLLRAGSLAKWARGMAVGVILFVLGLLFLAPSGGLQWEGFAPAGLGPALLWTAITLLFFVVQGPAEEVLFRGYLFPTLTARGGLLVGLGISSVFFALFHLLNPHLNLVAVLNLLLFGVLTGLYALREGSLWGVFGLHTSWNWVQGNVFGLPVSGQEMAPAPLFDCQTIGPTWWSGGDFGPEGGLAVTLILLGSIGVLLFWKRLRQKPEIVEPPFTVI